MLIIDTLIEDNVQVPGARVLWKCTEEDEARSLGATGIVDI